MKNDCCMCCKQGFLAANHGQPCDEKEGDMMCVDSFTACCNNARLSLKTTAGNACSFHLKPLCLFSGSDLYLCASNPLCICAFCKFCFDSVNAFLLVSSDTFMKKVYFIYFLIFFILSLKPRV